MRASRLTIWGQTSNRLWLRGSGDGLNPEYIPIIIIVGLELPIIGNRMARMLSAYKVPGEILLIILKSVSNLVTSSIEEFWLIGITAFAINPAIKVMNRKRNIHIAIDARAEVAVL